jgi:hypothetical protein
MTEDWNQHLEIMRIRRLPDEPGTADVHLVLGFLEDWAEHTEAGAESVYARLYPAGFTNLALALRRIIRAGYEEA